jgi:hypothetical protein
MDKCKLNGKYYDITYLRQYIPYCVDIMGDEFYMINRDYCYIQLDTKVNPLNKNAQLNIKVERIYLFKDGGGPWSSKNGYNNLNIIAKKISEITKNKKCMNENEQTTYLLNLCE